VNRICRLLPEPASIFALVEALEPIQQQRLMARAMELAERWLRTPPLRMRVILLALPRRGDVALTEVIVHLSPHRLAYVAPDITAAILEGRQPEGSPQRC
jgi:hypothetical protein